MFIYVFDVESANVAKEARYYQECLSALKRHSPKAHVFAMVHKMDLIRTNRKEVFVKKRDDILEASATMDVRVFGTSIWDESLYKVSITL